MVEMAIKRDARSMAMQEAIPSGMGERLQANIKGMATRPDKRSDSARHAKHKLVIVRSCVFLYTNAITSELAETMRQERTPRRTRGRWFPCPDGISCLLPLSFPVLFTVLLEMLKHTLVMFIVTVGYCSLSVEGYQTFQKGFLLHSTVCLITLPMRAKLVFFELNLLILKKTIHDDEQLVIYICQLK